MEKQQLLIKNLPQRPVRSGVQSLSGFSRPIDLVSNHFQITFKNAREVIAVYSIKIEPEIALDARQLKDKIMDAARKSIEDQGLKPFEVRGLNVWSQIKIEKPIIGQAVLTEQGQTYAVKLTFTTQFSCENISNEQSANPIVQSMNIKVKSTLRDKGLIEMGRTAKYYDPNSRFKNKIENAGLTVWRGFKTSLHIFKSVPYLLIDTASRVLRNQTALDFMLDIKDRYKNNEDVRQEMLGLSVIASYGNYRIYKVDDVKFDLNPRSKFTTPDGQISYIEYYLKKYKIKIRNENQPLLQYIDKRNPDKKTYLIPELMNMTGLTDTQRKDWNLMKDVAKYTKLTPDERNSDILQLRQTLAAGLEKKNLLLSSDQRVQGIQLDPPDIKLGKRNLKNDVGFFILKDAVLNPGIIKDWFLVYVSKGGRDDDDADFFVDQLKKSAQVLGIRLEKPYFIATKDTNPRSWVEALEYEIQQGGTPQMIVTFIPERDKDRLYGPLKDFCLNKKGISHQNVLLKFLKTKNPGSVASKIIQQMNVKIGCPIWSIPRPPKVNDRTMLVGIDIYHKLIKGNQSCMGIVCSLDPYFTKYFSRVILMKKGSEMTTEIASIIIQGIQAYLEDNGKKYLPENIVIYRDGVGEGQIQTLLQTELVQIEQSFVQFNKNFKPSLAFIMINKKINHRFFAGNSDQGSRAQNYRGAKSGPRNTLNNPPSGTIVADKITSSGFDFFLCAQYVTEGTCTPTHFSVLYNTTDWTEETFWMLTYYQCFNYMNWSGAVRVPACVQYAHKLSYLVGDTFQKQIHQNQQNFLAYL